jgi:hypothetical protein
MFNGIKKFLNDKEKEPGSPAIEGEGEKEIVTELDGFGMYVKILYGEELAALTEEQAEQYGNQIDEYMYRMFRDGRYNANIPEHNVTPEQYRTLLEYMEVCDRKQAFQDRRRQEESGTSHANREN